MSETIVAIYDDIGIARQVVEDLVNANFPRNSISLITNDANNQYSRYLDKDYTARNDAVTGGEGAGFGAVVGGLTGVLVGLAALTIPGIGAAIVAGPIVAGLTGIIAGAVAGGIAGALIKSGVPEDEAPYYAEGIRRGGTLISVETSDTMRAKDIINRQGAINIHERIRVWQQGGWQGFDKVAASDENENILKAPSDSLSAITTNSPIVSTAHTPHEADFTIVQPINEEERGIEEITAKSLLVKRSAAANDTKTPATPIANEETAGQPMITEPVMLVTDDDTRTPYQHMIDDFQPNKSTTNHSKEE
jgi:hypothetical protein